MDFVIVGPGAVGAVLGALLASDGHHVRFWVRPERRGALDALTVERVGGRSVRVDGLTCLGEGDPVAASDWVLICVRGEQLDGALRDVVRHMGPDRRIAIAAVSLQGVTEQARRAGMTGPVFALHASFGSYACSPGQPHFRWYPFRLATTVTPDGRRQDLAHARALARTLARAGLPARAGLSMAAAMRFLVAQTSVLAVGWDLCGWDLPRLVRDREVRAATARAMREAAPLVLPRYSPLRWLPAIAFGAFLRVLPLFIGSRARDIWFHHGPKIRGQTDDVVGQLVAQARASRVPVPALADLFYRWRDHQGLPGR